MTLEEALIKIKDEQKVDLFNNKEKVLDMLGDLIPGESDARKIKNRVKWAYEQGAIKALGSSSDHVMARNKAIAILKANTDLNEAAISDTIDSFCIAMQWKGVIPNKVQNPPTTIPSNPTIKTVSKPASQSIPQVPSQRNIINPAVPHTNAAPKVFGNNTVNVVSQKAKNALVYNVKDIIDGNIAVDDYVKKRASALLSKNTKCIIIHFLAQILFFCVICLVDTNSLNDIFGVLYTLGTLFFFLWEGCSFVYNITFSIRKSIRLLSSLIAGIIISVIYFIIPASISGFEHSDFKLFLQLMFWITMILGNVGRFTRIRKV